MIYDDQGTLYEQPLPDSHKQRLYDGNESIQREVRAQIKAEALKIEADMRSVLYKRGLNLDTDWPNLAKLGYNVIYQRTPLNIPVYRGIKHVDDDGYTVWDIDHYPDWG